LISFIQFANPESDAPEVHFLSIQNVLEKSTSASADTLVKLITEEIKANEIKAQQFCQQWCQGDDRFLEWSGGQVEGGRSHT